jgi:hypothetical protein
VKVFVNNRNLFIWPKALVERIQAEGHDPVVVDGGSTYPPLLDWYATKPCEIVLLGRHYSHHAPWQAMLPERMVEVGAPYAETDPDLDISSVPKGFLEHLVEGFDRHRPWANKAALSIALDDLPDTEMGRRARYDQRWMWGQQVTPGWYRCDTDTTFAVYRRDVGQWDGFDSVRAAVPFTCRHMPWYLDRPENFPEDFIYYLEHLGGGPWRYSVLLRQKVWPGSSVYAEP